MVRRFFVGCGLLLALSLVSFGADEPQGQTTGASAH